MLAEPVGAWSSQGGVSQVVGLPPDIAQASQGRLFSDLEQLVSHDDAMWVGYLGYDLARQIERIGEHAQADRRWPDAVMNRCPGWLVHDRVEQRWWACGAWASSPNARPNLPALPLAARSFSASPVQPDMTQAQYLERVGRVLDYIAAGDVFQVNLTQRMGSDFKGSPRALYDALIEQSPAWYGTYLEFPAPGSGSENSWPAIASISPELFFSLDADGTVTTRPIKGTRPADAAPDELLDSAKDAAELAMIVDLLRNDLGRVCGYGSIHVEAARDIEHHPTVQHGVATITGELHPGRGLADLLRAVLPGGSITGAPKVRAMQIIEELEPTRRGPYCGAIGWLKRDENNTHPSLRKNRVYGAFNLAIRTVLVDQGRAEFGVGGGLVADSDPAAEHAETLTKAAAMLAALQAGRGGTFHAGGSRPDFATVDP